jgi:hypothetical protein
MQFEVANFETAYIMFLRRSELTKFMAIPHYAYLVLKMPGPNNIITIKGDVKHAYNCDMVSCESVDMIIASAELQELKKALAESPPRTRSCPRPSHLRLPSSQRSHSAKQSHYPRMSLLRSLMWGIVWIPNRNSPPLNSTRKIGTYSHGSLLACQEFLGN